MADKAGAMQVFLWHGQGAVKEDGRTYYQTFSLNGVQYQIGDFVYLYPENDDDYPHYIGQIQKAFVDASASLQDPHCIEIKWFERRTNLEPTTKGIEESEKEVFELDDTDINPIGCISGKCTIIRATHYEHAWHRMKEHDGVDWYFCRGYFRQATNSFEAYTPEEIGEQPSALLQPFQGPQQTAQPSASQQPQGHSVQRAYQSGYNHSPASQQQLSFEADADDLPASKRKATGRACLQCGATSTPQWREGPEGPKTLCNACGVRYVRSLQKGGQRKASASGQGQQARSTPTAATQKNLQGSLKEASTTPQAPQSSTVASPKARQSGQRTNARKSVVPKDTTLAQQRSPSAMQKAELCKPQAAGSKSNSSSSSATVAKNVGTAARVKHVAVA